MGAPRGSNRQARGQSLVEFALIVPVMFVLLLIAIDFGRLFFTYIQISNAAREAANYAALHAADKPFDNATYLLGAEQAALSEANTQGQLGEGGLTVESITCFDPTAAPPQPPVGCNAAAQWAAGIGMQVMANVSESFSFFTPFVSDFFGGSLTLQASATAPVLNPPAPLPTPTPTPAPGTLVVQKNVVGDLTNFGGGDFVFDVSCNNVAYGPITITFAAGQTTGSSPAVGVPAGYRCIVTETSVPHPEAHASWSATPSPVTLAISSAAQSVATVTNTRGYNPPGPSPRPTPSPTPTPPPCTSPTVSLSPSSVTGDKNQNTVAVSYTGISSGTPTAWLWDFGDGTQDTSPSSAAHTFTYNRGNGKQTWTVTMTVTVNGGCSASATGSVSLNP